MRVVRALEVYRATGRPIGEHHRAGAGPLDGFESRVLVLDPARERLRAAVEERTDAMLAGGLMEETRAAARALSAGRAAAAGHRVSPGGRGRARRRGRSTQARRDIVVETMRYAKRQRTWFRHQETATWFADAGPGRRGRARWLDGRGMTGPFRRAIVVVCDGLGVGEAPDAAAFGDEGSDTLGHVLASRDVRDPATSPPSASAT